MESNNIFVENGAIDLIADAMQKFSSDTIIMVRSYYIKMMQVLRNMFLKVFWMRSIIIIHKI